jgi:hypothetical protein
LGLTRGRSNGARTGAGRERDESPRTEIVTPAPRVPLGSGTPPPSASRSGSPCSGRPRCGRRWGPKWGHGKTFEGCSMQPGSWTSSAWTAATPTRFSRDGAVSPRGLPADAARPPAGVRRVVRESGPALS